MCPVFSSSSVAGGRLCIVSCLLLFCTSFSSVLGCVPLSSFPVNCILYSYLVLFSYYLFRTSWSCLLAPFPHACVRRSPSSLCLLPHNAHVTVSLKSQIKTRMPDSRLGIAFAVFYFLPWRGRRRGRRRTGRRTGRDCFEGWGEIEEDGEEGNREGEAVRGMGKRGKHVMEGKAVKGYCAGPEGGLARHLKATHVVNWCPSRPFLRIGK